MSDRPTRHHGLFESRLPAPNGVHGSRIVGFEDVRLSIEQADGSLAAAADRLSLPRSPMAEEGFNILAISGGAAGGAFGPGGGRGSGARPGAPPVGGHHQPG